MACNCLLQLIYFYILEVRFWKLCIIWSLKLMNKKLLVLLIFFSNSFFVKAQRIETL